MVVEGETTEDDDMACLTVQTHCGNPHTDGDTGYSYDGDATVRISNDAAENGYDQDPGPLDWLNSARITTDPEDDAVRCAVSVGDPRGAFVFTVRRLPDGRLVIHVPYPGESLAHVETSQLHEGTLLVAGDFSSAGENEGEGEEGEEGEGGPHDDSFAHSTVGEVEWVFFPPLDAAGAAAARDHLGRRLDVDIGGDPEPEDD
jgi:hypothetical protein